MYRLSINLIGNDDKVMPNVRREILNERGSVDAEFPDIPSLLKSVWLETGDSRLFIVHVPDEECLNQFRRLTVTYVGQPTIAVVDPANDPAIVVKAMRAGATQVVPLPLGSDDFHAAMECIAVQYGLAAGHARMFAIAGATGGCGTTSIALNLAYEIAYSRHIHSILLELSLRMGVVASLLNVQPKRTTADLLANPDGIDSFLVRQSLTQVMEDFDILSGPCEAISSTAIRPEDILKLIKCAEPLATAIVLDIPCTYDDAYFHSLAAVDQRILIAEQSVSSVRGVRMVCDALGRERPTVIVNRYNPTLSGFSVDKLRDILQLPHIYTVADDPAMAAAADNGRPLRVQAPRSKALANILGIMDELLPPSGPSAPGNRKSTLLQTLTSVLSR
jgi:pilus assembly protein CpaE